VDWKVSVVETQVLTVPMSKGIAGLELSITGVPAGSEYAGQPPMDTDVVTPPVTALPRLV
jgi:hypothetical protein